MGLSGYIKQAITGKRSGSTILEDLLCRENLKSPILGNLKLKETITFTCWYLWWQRRKIVKGESVAGSRRTAFAIQALTSNFIHAASSSNVVRDISWKNYFEGLTR
jgi:hypothetical protein